MRTLRLLVMVAMLGLPLTATLHPVSLVGSQVVAADPPVAGDAPVPKVNVTINDGQHVWYANPFVLAIGGIGILLILVMIVLAARGNSTTIIKE